MNTNPMIELVTLCVLPCWRN